MARARVGDAEQAAYFDRWRKQNGKSQLPHGVDKTYFQGCKCPLCRDAISAYHRARRPPKPPPTVYLDDFDTVLVDPATEPGSPRLNALARKAFVEDIPNG